MHYQQSLFNSAVFIKDDFQPIYDPAWNDTSNALESTSCVRGQVSHTTNATVPEHIHWVEEYWVKRSDKKHYYYRYCWAIGRKKYRCHIPGGNSSTPLATYRKSDIEALISDGLPPAKIVNIINTNFK
ncbi:hypothetical protein IQ247_18130 [Plectonema cf. radiosum LEGE 06105]|uniref:Uncharacterized protein n=1 Tax=Plectonema cf. radiosum LEGE 06105 TaxID=945769 RepID=A0A8J7F566_9CYAN|nr:hypothetical protein [Plectonema radiosum]MBE9214563.1 hypothetical protein [Plectonema cf. radiosum LEGE 06105]